MSDVSEIVSQITQDVRTIVAGEIELAKAELLPSAKAAGIGAGLFGGAGYLAMSALHLLLLAAAGGIGLLYMLAGMDLAPALVLGVTTMAVLLLIFAGIFAAAGRAQVKKAKGPEQAIANAEGAMTDVRLGMARGRLEVEAKLAARKRHGVGADLG